MLSYAVRLEAEAQNERRNKMKKSKILSALLCLTLVFSVCLAGCGSKEEKPEEEKLSCSITVTAADVLENEDLIAPEKLELVPEDGIIYSGTVEFEEGDTLYSVLTEALSDEKVQFEAENSSYFVAFGNIYASDCEYGGWLYSVNGVEPTVGASEYKLADGDSVEFFYVCDYNAYYSAA